MTIDKIDPVWASDGTSGYLVAPADSKIERGWAPNDQPANPWENWKNKRAEDKINEVVQTHNLTSEAGYFDSVYDKCSGLPSVLENIMHPTTTKNKKGMPNDLIMCRGYDFLNNRECVFSLGRTDPTVLHVIYNQLDADPDWTYATFSLSGLAATAAPIDICCDGHFIFIATNDAGSAGSTISRYALSPSTIVNATRDAHWPISGGERFTEHGTWVSPAIGRQMCIADDDNIAFLDTVNNQIGLMSKELDTAPTYGKGQLLTIDAIPSSTVTLLPRGICSDGTHIWALAYVEISAADYDHLFAVLISDPTDATAGISRAAGSMYLPTGSQARMHDVCFDGVAIHVISLYELSHAHSAYISTYDLYSSFWNVGRYYIPSGNVSTVSARRWTACVTFTGRSIAAVMPVCPMADLSVTDLFTLGCNQSQIGLALLETDRGGYNVVAGASFLQNITVTDKDVMALEYQSVDTVYNTRTGSVVFADNCIWVMTHVYKVSDDSFHLTRITRVPLWR
jgi:hypothetical protein